MSDSTMVVNKSQAFINARLSYVRLVSEKTISAPALPTKEPQQVQLHTDTSSGFSIGLDSPEKPSIIAIGIDYKVSLTIPSTEKQVVEYEARHEAQFVLVEWTGFEDWTLMPPSAMTPYLAVMHNIALRKAEATLFDMGLKGVALPLPEKFDGDDSATNGDDAAIASKV